MNKTIFAAALILGTAVTASASDQTNKPSSSQNTGVSQNQPMIQTPFKVWPDGNWIFVDNYGTFDWTAALDVWAFCTPVAPTVNCGSNFVGGKYLAAHYDAGKFPKGHGQAPNKGSGNAQQMEGYGWVAVFMGLPAGSFKITAKAGNNSSPETPVTIAGAQSNISAHPGVQVNPVGALLDPTKTPTPGPRRP